MMLLPFVSTPTATPAVGGGETRFGLVDEYNSSRVEGLVGIKLRLRMRVSRAVEFEGDSGRVELNGVYTSLARGLNRDYSLIGGFDVIIRGLGIARLLGAVSKGLVGAVETRILGAVRKGWVRWTKSAGCGGQGLLGAVVRRLLGAVDKGCWVRCTKTARCGRAKAAGCG